MAKAKADLAKGLLEKLTQDNSTQLDKSETVKPELNTQSTGAGLDVKACRDEMQAGGLNLNITPRIKPETRTRRVQAVFKPSIYESLEQKAAELGYSVNEVLNQLVEVFLRQN